MKIGDYVRTKNQGIKKIDTIFENATVNKYGYEVDDYEYNIIRTDDIIKSSSNIIDLIEVGDYVNGCKVCEIIDKDKLGYYEASKGTRGKKAKEKSFCLNNNYTMKFVSREIENVVTKEQFENMKYRIGE